MGMYDELTCNYPLPDKFKKYQNKRFQTKSLGNCLSQYLISREGQLIEQTFDWLDVPEEERPYYNKPEWNRLSWVGALETIPNEPTELNYTGEVRFYTSDQENDSWIEFVALFSKGKLILLDPVESDI
jgi:hypothetical protein